MLEPVGVKLGSLNTVVAYRKRIIRELTVVARTGGSLSNPRYVFSHSALRHSSAVYPLRFGMPTSEESASLLSEYVKWLLKDISEESFMVFAVPMMNFEQGVALLKKSLSTIKAKQLFTEAFCTAVNVLCRRATEIEEKVFLVANLGSTTTEFAVFDGFTRRASRSYPEPSGNQLDREIASLLSERLGGAYISDNEAREIKERFSLDNPRDFSLKVLVGGRIRERVIRNEWLRESINSYLADVLSKTEEFLSQVEPELLSRLVNFGSVVVGGGMCNLKGSRKVIAEKMEELLDLKPSFPKDGVAAPALGARLIAEHFITS